MSVLCYFENPNDFSALNISKCLVVVGLCIGRFRTSPLFEGLDIVRDSTYTITIYSDPIVGFRGELKDFISLMNDGYDGALDKEAPGTERAYQRAPLTRRGYDLALESLKDF